MFTYNYLLAAWFVNTILGQALNQTNEPSFYKCDRSLYGGPTIEQCASVLNAMPGIGSQKVTPKLEQTRKFVEPQFLDPPYRALRQVYEGEIEQLPKIWRFSIPLITTTAVNRIRN